MQYIHTYIHTYICMYIHACMHTYICIHTPCASARRQNARTRGLKSSSMYVYILSIFTCRHEYAGQDSNFEALTAKHLLLQTEVRRSSTPGACFVDRRIHEYVEDVVW